MMTEEMKAIFLTGFSLAISSW